MAEFYKTLFAPYHKQWLESMKKQALPNILSAFAMKFFEDIMSKMSSL